MATTTTLTARFTPPPPSIPSNNPSQWQSRTILTSEAATLSAKHRPPIHLTKTLDNRRDSGPAEKRHKKVMIEDEEIHPVGVADFIERSKEMMGVGFGKDVSGPPRWFTPLDCDGEGRIDGAPVLLYLPGILIYGVFIFLSWTGHHLKDSYSTLKELYGQRLLV